MKDSFAWTIEAESAFQSLKEELTRTNINFTQLQAPLRHGC